MDRGPLKYMTDRVLFSIYRVCVENVPEVEQMGNIK